MPTVSPKSALSKLLTSSLKCQIEYSVQCPKEYFSENQKQCHSNYYFLGFEITTNNTTILRD